MTRAEALVLLIWCVPLASKLAKDGISTELTREDKITLDGFSRVWEAGWLKNPVIYHMTGLSRSDIENLTAKMQKEKEPQSATLAPENTTSTQPVVSVESKTTPVASREFAEAKELFMAERYIEVLEKLYPLAAVYPENLEIQELLNQCLRARREPSKLTITPEIPLEKPVRFPQRLVLLLKGKGRGKVKENSAQRTLISTPLP